MEIKLTNVVFPNRKRLLMIMMKTLIFLCCTTVFSFTPSNVLSQNSKIKIEADKTLTVDEVFDLIMDQTDYRFIYEKGIFKNFPNVAVHKGTISTNSLLVKSLANKNLNIIVTANNTILIKEAKTVQQIQVSGKVTDEKGLLLPGVTVLIKGTNKGTVTDFEGSYTITVPNPENVLLFSYLGYETQEILVAGKSIINVTLKEQISELGEVTLNFNTGYQQLPKERATGSFTTVDTKTLSRSVGTNILDRLDGVTSGLLKYPRPIGANSSRFAIHGRSTLFANPDPLIVLDGFPYDGSIEQINPTDIESITILKDAAAASIWGVRSGNGVIVITTKNGRKNQKMIVEVNTTTTVSEKPDLYYIPQITSSDYIELEEYLFDKGLYKSRFSNAWNPVSAAVELFNQRKNGEISDVDYATQINALKGYDVRKDMERYMYRSAIQQQHQLNIRGGSDNHVYYLSGGYDKNLGSLVTDQYERITLNTRNKFYFLNDKLNITADVNFISSTDNNSPETYNPFSPYDRMADETGASLPVINRSGFRVSYAETAGNGQLLDWQYRPKDELVSVGENKRIQYRIKPGINYELIKGLNLAANYLFLEEKLDNDYDYDVNRFYTRNLINRYSSISGTTVNRVIPLGNILQDISSSTNSQIFRGQLSYNKTIGVKHKISAIAGYESSHTKTTYKLQYYYGYNPDNQTHANATINPTSNYPHYTSGTSQINTSASLLTGNDVNQSYYANASYSYQERYILSGSARRDESNIFGVKANQKGVPLWSVGFAWNVNKEQFYNVDWLSDLKIRATYGYNGNVDKSASAYLTAMNSPINNIYGSPFSQILNPPNPSLRWEKIKTWNMGLDFTLKNNIINGSIDIYTKKAVDLIGNNLIAPQTGITEYFGNGADVTTKGVDVVLNSNNLKGWLKWNTSLLLNYNTDKVTKYKVKQLSNQEIIRNNADNPLVGYPFYSIFSFPSAGLNNEGMPQGYLDGEISTDYTTITSTLDPDQIKYHGSGSPKYFGSLINTFNYRNFELSFNITYKLGYYFRRENVFGGSNYGSSIFPVYQLGDYEKRWKEPGDELTTNIPALVYPSNIRRNYFFQYSEDLVEKGDHIRLQDIRLSYHLRKMSYPKLPFQSVSIFLYTRNLGILWRANGRGIDPDYRTSAIPQPFSASIGVNLKF
jgi:TonB-linked SusC/RagA family outer membrane protein